MAGSKPASHAESERPMPDYDLVIRNGTVVTAADTSSCDVAIKDGTVVALGRGLAAGARIPGRPMSVQRKVIAAVKKALNSAP